MDDLRRDRKQNRASRIDDPDRPIFCLTDSHKNQAQRMLAEMLEGGTVNRHNCENLGIARKNASVHSIASSINNEFDVPVCSELNPEGICDYWMAPEDIRDFKDPDRRVDQAKRQRNQTQAKRFRSRLRGVLRMIASVIRYPRIMELYPFVLDEFKHIHLKLGELIQTEESRPSRKTKAANEADETTQDNGGDHA